MVIQYILNFSAVSHVIYGHNIINT